MGVSTLYDRAEEVAAFYDNTTGVAFGPVFDGLDTMPEEIHGVVIAGADDIAEAFLAHLRNDLGIDDPRHKHVETLVREYGRWRQAIAIAETV